MQQINNQNPAIINDYSYYYYQFPPNMYGFPPPYFQQYIEPPKNLQENLNMIYQRGIVNNIIGAFFIKEYKEKKANNEKRKVPISMVELGDDQDNNNNNLNNKDIDNNNKNNYEKKIDNDGNNKLSINENNVKDDQDNYNEEEKNNEDNKQKEKEGNNNSNSQENELKKPDIIF